MVEQLNCESNHQLGYATDLQYRYRCQSVAKASAEASYTVPPRRAHGTLQPQDESVIVGYYTSTEVPPAWLVVSIQTEERGVLIYGKR